MNDFLRSVTELDVLTENGAVAHSTTSNVFLDQFGLAASYRGRELHTVFADQATLHAEDAQLALRFVFYLRGITRNVTQAGEKFYDPNVTQFTGAGARDESLKRLLWYANSHPVTFRQNLFMIGLLGRYRDFWDLIVLAETNDLAVDWTKWIPRMVAFNSDPLWWKYVPLAKSSKKLKTDRSKIRNKIAKAVANELNLSEKDMRLSKSASQSHNWQKAISRKTFSDINWKNIPGKALQILANKFVENQGLSNSFLEFLKSSQKVSFNGYAYELIKVLRKRDGLIQRSLTDLQFESLLEKGRERMKNSEGITENVWCAIDTSGSMTSRVSGSGFDEKDYLSCLDVCLGLGLYFASLNTGAFAKNVVMFDTHSKVKQLRGSFSQMYDQLIKSTIAWGSTNFNSVINEIIRVRMQKGDSIPLEDYPTTLLVVSDMQFNVNGSSKSYFNSIQEKLSEHFPAEWVKNFKVVWWNVKGAGRGDSHVFHSNTSDLGAYYFSGFDGAPISFLLGENDKIEKVTETGETVEVQKSAIDVMNEALNQPLLQLVEFS